MRLRYFVRVLLAAIALGGIYGCSEGDEAIINIDAPTTTTTTNNTTAAPDDAGGGSASTVSENCPDWAGAKRKDADGNDVCALPAEINESRLLTSDIVWLMEGRVTVGNGNKEMSTTRGELADGSSVINATLTIQSGTHIRASSGTFANLIITRGSRIQAEGTADAPIVFSSDDDDMTGSGEWGGLIIHGYGEHNQCNAPQACNIDAEGESGMAGGYTADDNSGTLRYVIVTEGGYEFAPGDEINGISLVGVGSGTTMQYIQVNDNSDDGIEFYGGAVNVKHIVLTNNLDDSVDWDEGFVGNMQYVLVKQSPEVGGNAIEADTEGAAMPLSKPTIANATFVANGDETEALVFKAASGGFLHNSVITAAAGYATLEDCVDVSRATDNANALVFNNVIADCADEGTGNFYVGGTVKGMETNIYAVEAELDDNYASQATAAMLDAPIDWADYNAMNAESTADPDYLDATDYLGAVDPDGSDLWYQGWTIEGSL